MVRIAFFFLATLCTHAIAQQLHRNVVTLDPQPGADVASAEKASRILQQNATDEAVAEQTLIAGPGLRCGLSGIGCGTFNCPCSNPVAASYCNSRRPGICSFGQQPVVIQGPSGPRGPPGPRGVRGPAGAAGNSTDQYSSQTTSHALY
jgi:hypothetical protein